MGLPEDEIALKLFREGDLNGAVAQLMETHEGTVFAYCMRTLRERELAEDTAQKVFIEVHRDLERFRGDSSMRSWLIGIAHHRCADAIKARARLSAKVDHDDEAVSGHVDPGATQSEQLEVAQEVGALDDCLAELTHETRETVLLRFLSGMTYEEMATVLGKKADTLCVRVARALPLLKRCLERKGWNHE